MDVSITEGPVPDAGVRTVRADHRSTAERRAAGGRAWASKLLGAGLTGGGTHAATLAMLMAAVVGLGGIALLLGQSPSTPKATIRTNGYHRRGSQVRSGRWSSLLLCLALFAGGCSGDGSPAAAPTVVDGKAAEAKRQEQERAFASCMRDNGVQLNDDPAQRRVDEIKADDVYMTAFKACGHLQPTQILNQEEAVKNLEHRRKNAQCMRENGFPAWPDPDPLVDSDPPPAGVDLNKALETLTMCSRKNS